MSEVKNNHEDLKLRKLDECGNMLIDPKKGYGIIKLNQAFYPVEAVQFAAHYLTEEANIIINGDSPDKLVIEIFLKDQTRDIEAVFWKFNESLIAHTVYLIQSDRNKEIRESILKKALSIEK
ncbi:MAG: hypothetical protein ACM3SY_13510 [Candidatus Omnitrophota bacterium]